MADYNKLQTNVASGRFTFPVVILVCLLLWGISIRQWPDVAGLLACALTVFLLLEINTTFSLIRMRSALHAVCFVFLSTICFFLHPFQATAFVPVAFLLALSQLFKSYEASSAPADVFHSFFFLGLGSLLFPQLIYFVPLFYVGMAVFRSLSLRSFFAGWVGLTVPYWFLFGYALYVGRMELFYRPFREAFRFVPIRYEWTLEQGVAGLVVALLSLISSVHYFQIAYQDKVRTRLFLSFLIAVEGCVFLFAALQPCHFEMLFRLQLLWVSLFLGHWFTVSRTRFSGIFFRVVVVILLSLALYNVWMQFFNF